MTCICDHPRCDGVNNPPTREDKQIDRAFRDLSVFMFGFMAGVIAVAFFASGI